MKSESPSRVAAPRGSFERSSEAIHVPLAIESSLSSAHFFATIADISPVNASHSPEINLSVASAASAVPTDVKVILLDENQSCMFPSVVVPTPTQMFAPSKPDAELLAFAAGKASSRTKIPCPSKKFIPAKSALRSASRLVVQVVVRIRTSIVPDDSLSNLSEPEAGMYSTPVSGFRPIAAATALQ